MYELNDSNEVAGLSVPSRINTLRSDGVELKDVDKKKGVKIDA